MYIEFFQQKHLLIIPELGLSISNLITIGTIIIAIIGSWVKFQVSLNRLEKEIEQLKAKDKKSESDIEQTLDKSNTRHNILLSKITDTHSTMIRLETLLTANIESINKTLDTHNQRLSKLEDDLLRVYRNDQER